MDRQRAAQHPRGQEPAAILRAGPQAADHANGRGAGTVVLRSHLRSRERGGAAEGRGAGRAVGSGEQEAR